MAYPQTQWFCIATLFLVLRSGGVVEGSTLCKSSNGTMNCSNLVKVGLNVERQELDLQSVGLRELSEKTFHGLTDLKELLLSRNFLTSLPPGIFNGLKSLEVIHLKGNQITDLHPDVFSGLTSLRILTLSNNKLKKLPDGMLRGLTNLAAFVVDGNQLTSLPVGVFRDNPNLATLSVSNNILSEVPDGAITGLSSLRNVDFGNNKIIEFVPAAFAGLSSLRSLDMLNNRMTTLPKYDGNAWPLLKEASFWLNNITEVDEATFRSWLTPPKPDWRILNIQRNPLSKPSSLRWALDDPNVEAQVYMRRCSQGSLKQGNASIRFSVDLPCKGDPNWTESTPSDWMKAAMSGRSAKTQKN